MVTKRRSTLNGVARAANARERNRGADPITAALRRLQEAKATEDTDVQLTIQALVPAAAAACAAGHLVSLSRVRGGTTILFRIRDGEDWLDWFCADEAFAGDVAEAIVEAFNATE